MKTFRILNDVDIKTAIAFWLKSQNIIVTTDDSGEALNIQVADTEDGLQAQVETMHGPTPPISPAEPKT